MTRLSALVLSLSVLAGCELCDTPITDGTEACVYIECKEQWTGDAAQGEEWCQMQVDQ